MIFHTRSPTAATWSPHLFNGAAPRHFARTCRPRPDRAALPPAAHFFPTPLSSLAAAALFPFIRLSPLAFSFNFLSSPRLRRNYACSAPGFSLATLFRAAALRPRRFSAAARDGCAICIRRGSGTGIRLIRGAGSAKKTNRTAAKYKFARALLV